jgi:lipopolysaccharide export system protein LptA
MYLTRKLSQLVLTLLCAPFVVFALPDDSKQIMHIVADATTFNYKTGSTTYEGNVKIDQGSTHLTADRVTTTNNSKHKIEEAIAYGLNNKLAEYVTLPKQGDAILRAKAKTIKFYPGNSTVLLEGNVIVMQGKNSFEGPVVIYNMKDQIVTAPASKTGRATVVIEPSQFRS